jgi:enterochelin esterase family protein
MKNNRICLALLGVCLFASTYATAQPSNRPPNPGDTLQTVVVNPDNRVTFSFYAPNASTVTVGGDFLLGAPAPSLTKADNGVWSWTSNPIPPDSYTYNFTVDGVGVLDTKSPNFRENPNSLFNYFDMPGPETDFMALKNVPHGRVEKIIYHSNSLNMERRIHVYLPPNYESIKGKLPVLYLLHGYGDNDISWTSAGKMDLILDNLYAAGKLKNMIVVMPDGHVPGQQGRTVMADAVVGDTNPFITDFLHDLMPFVEKSYPVSTRREDTAIAGFSMGGVQTLNIALGHPERFDYVFGISTGFFPDSLKDLDEKYPDVLKNVASHPFKQFYIARGKDDPIFTATVVQGTRNLLDKYGIAYKYEEMNGMHSFVFSRRFLASVFPLMFR